jgi:hypothetical protein
MNSYIICIALCVNSLISFFQVIEGAKSDLHYDVFDKESQ